jgi:hypothetical protein
LHCQVDGKIKKSLEVAALTQAKPDELARAQVEASEQTKQDKLAHKALIDAGVKGGARDGGGGQARREQGVERSAVGGGQAGSVLCRILRCCYVVFFVFVFPTMFSQVRRQPSRSLYILRRVDAML